MYCILVTGIPASGKSTMARFLAEAFGLPVISKDRIKECMYDTIGFRSREELEAFTPKLVADSPFQVIDYIKAVNHIE